MTRLREGFRALVITAAVVVTAASLLAFRWDDWPIYVTFVAVSLLVYAPHVEVLPRVVIGIPELAATTGFLYIGGLPILLLRNVTPLIAVLCDRALPLRWKARLPTTEWRGAALARAWLRDLPVERWADYSAFVVAMGIRWCVASVVADDTPPVESLAAIVAGELAGYAFWTLGTVASIFSFRIPIASREEGMRPVLHDLGLIMVMALTPFVFLIAYGYQTLGLAGAALWSIASLGIHFMLASLTERRLTVEAQNRTLEQLNHELEHRERLSAIGKMSSVVSHQMLQQLGVIGIYANLVRTAAAADGDQAETLARVREHGKAIEGALEDVNRVLRDLLVFSRDLKLNLYQHPVATLVDEAAAAARQQAGEAGVTVRVDCPADLQATVDKLKVKQAIENVLRNAIEVSPRGSEVTVQAAARDGAVEIVVGDAGPGVPPERREAIFTPFFTTKEHGTGLGLAIAREFTSAHGGTLSVEPSSRAQGSRFVFRIPAQPGASTLEHG